MADNRWPDWTRTVESNAGGRTQTRTIRITYPHRSPPSPENERGVGMVLTVFSATVGTFLGVGMLLMSVTLSRNNLELIVCLAISAGLLAYWWYMGLGTMIRAIINRRRRHTIHGVVADRTDHFWESDSHDFWLWYVAVDDGTKTEIIGWEVPRETHDRLALGTEVDAVVSGDRRYLYSITPSS